MIRFYKVKPISVVFFRDPKPFTAGEQALARLQFPPRLNPFLGALRTKFLEEKAKTEGKNIPEIFEKYEQQLHDISIIWFSMLKNNQPILPLPLDIFTDWQPLQKGRFVYEGPSQQNKEVRIPIMRSEYLEKGAKSQKTGGFLTLRGFLEYKDGKVPPEDALIPLETLWQFENRVGITLNSTLKSAERTKFYRITVARPEKDVGFLVGVEFADDSDLPDIFDSNFTTRLGGEGHIAVWEKIEEFKGSEGNIHFNELVALTHVPVTDNGDPKFEVINWCINKLDIISGWDYRVHRPKSLHKVLKPGSVLSVGKGKDSKPTNGYKIKFSDRQSIFVVKDLQIYIGDSKEDVPKSYLVDFKPVLGEPNTLFIVKK